MRVVALPQAEAYGMRTVMDCATFRQRYAHLTTMQRRVLRLRCQGLQNAQIGYELYIEPQTVKNHVWAVFTALGISGGRGSGSRSAGVCYVLGKFDAEQTKETQ